MGVSNGALGAAFANYHLQQIFVYLHAKLINDPEVMIDNAKAEIRRSRPADRPTDS